MPNYRSYGDDLYKLSDDPVKAKAQVVAMDALKSPDHGSLITQITNLDSTVKQEKASSLFKRFKEAGK